MSCVGPFSPKTYRETRHQVPLDGGSPRTQHFVWKDVQSQFYSADTAFYSRTVATGYTQVTLSNGKSYNEFLANTSLYARPFTGGADRLIIDGLPSTGGRVVLSGDTGLSMLLIRPYPRPTYDLLHIPANGGKPNRITDYHSASLPVRFQERLWWLEFEPIAGVWNAAHQ
jgi:hypothetical protein